MSIQWKGVMPAVTTKFTEKDTEKYYEQQNGDLGEIDIVVKS